MISRRPPIAAALIEREGMRSSLCETMWSWA